MFLFDHFNILLKIIHWAGLAPFTTLDGKVRYRTFIVSVIVSLLINVSIIAVLLKFRFYELYGNIETIVNYVFIGSISILNLSANVQCYHYKSIYKKIVNGIVKMENSFHNKFSKKISFQKFAFSYRLKIFIVCTLLCIYFILQFYESWLQKDLALFVFNVLSLLTECMASLALFHVTLYIFTVKMFINELNQRIRNSPICFYTSSQVEFLKTIKSMHMDISKLMVQINKFFSWNLPFLIINLAIQSIYNVFWIFLNLQVKWNFLYCADSFLELLYCLFKISVLVNSSHSLLVETTHTMENIEEYAFRTNENINLYLLKNEVIEQIKNFPIFVTADGYFIIDRSFLAGVTANCLTYIIIFIQFFLQSDVSKNE